MDRMADRRDERKRNHFPWIRRRDDRAGNRSGSMASQYGYPRSFAAAGHEDTVDPTRLPPAGAPRGWGGATPVPGPVRVRWRVNMGIRGRSPRRDMRTPWT